MKLSNRFYAGIFIVMLIFLFSPSTMADADILDDMESSFFTGIIVGGDSSDAQTIVESITMFTPERKTFLGIPLDYAELKLIQFGSINNGGDSTLMLSEFTYAGRLWESDTFFLSIKQIDEPYDKWGGGFLYDWKHWDSDLPSFIFGLYVMESGDFLYTIDGEYEFQNGYFLGCDVQLGMETPFNRDWFDGDIIYLKKDLNPEGEYFAKLGMRNLFGTNYLYGGIGGTL